MFGEHSVRGTLFDVMFVVFDHVRVFVCVRTQPRPQVSAMFDHVRLNAVRNCAFGVFGLIMFGRVFVVFGRLVFGVRIFCVRVSITSVCSKVC